VQTPVRTPWGRRGQSLLSFYRIIRLRVTISLSDHTEWLQGLDLGRDSHYNISNSIYY